MVDKDVVGSLEGYLQQRQFLKAGHQQALERSRLARESTAFSRQATGTAHVLPSASAAVHMHLDDARRQRHRLAAARPGQSLPATTALSDKQLGEFKARTDRDQWTLPTRGL